MLINYCADGKLLASFYLIDNRFIILIERIDGQYVVAHYTNEATEWDFGLYPGTIYKVAVQKYIDRIKEFI